MFETLPILFSAALAAAPLTDRTAEAGIRFSHFNGMIGKHHFPEMMGAGVGLLDYDRDGDLDLYLVQGALLDPAHQLEDVLIKPEGPLLDRLYRNEGNLKFVDVTDEAKIAGTGYGMGVSVADLNNDGWPDLYLSNFGPNQLWLNQGDGTFTDATSEWGAGDDRWTVTAVAFDYDRDGWQDLYLVNYVDYAIKGAKVCRSHSDLPDYCSPQSYKPSSDRLLRNQAGAKFQQVTGRAGMSAAGPGLGAVAGDFNGDGWPDLYVANDGAANFLWLNQRDGRFIDDALLAGVAVNMAGMAEASMGVDAGDFDGDGDLDLFMTHLDRQTNTLYENDGQGWFLDKTLGTVLGSTSFAYTGFGTGWFDLDNDGWLDLISANGAVVDIAEQKAAGVVLPLRQRNQLWRNRGDGRYEDLSGTAGEPFRRARVSRGAAFGDVDNDGDVDVVLTNNAGPAELLINESSNKNSWIGLVPRTAGGAVALGTQVRLQVDGRTLVRRSRTDGSYVSAHDPRILIGLGSHRGPVAAELRWPDGRTQRIEGLAINQYHELTPPAP
ncbi:MAG: CRTAC1 family protein [Pseudomonadota bacterium]